MLCTIQLKTKTFFFFFNFTILSIQHIIWYILFIRFKKIVKSFFVGLVAVGTILYIYRCTFYFIIVFDIIIYILLSGGETSIVPTYIFVLQLIIMNIFCVNKNVIRLNEIDHCSYRICTLAVGIYIYYLIRHTNDACV
jgi:hypothetical protein